MMEAILAEFAEVERVETSLLRFPLRTPTLPPATTTNHYLVGGRRAVEVDPSTPERPLQDRLCALVERLETTADWHFEALFLTHHHYDHAGAADVLATRLQLPVWAHPITAELLRGQVKIDRLVEDGEVVAECFDGKTWRAMHTPGHAPGHLVLLHEDGGMVAGDMVAGEGTILIDPSDGRMSDYLSSLERMRQREPSYLAPAHGPVLRDADQCLRFYCSHRLQREARIAAALDDQWQADDAMLPEAYGDVSRMIWPVALRSMRSHLIHLAEQGRAERDGDRWRRTG